jgi:hypothetical protein
MLPVTAPGTLSFYDQTLVVGVGGITAGTPITLPAAGTYQGAELMLWFRGQALEYIYDYTYVGSAPHTQVTLTFNLVQTDRLRFTTETLT